MGKSSQSRRLADNEAMAKGRMIRTSGQKLNLVAQTIRGQKVERAIADLSFSPKRIAKDVKKVLESAVANAENNHGPRRGRAHRGGSLCRQEPDDEALAPAGTWSCRQNHEAFQRRSRLWCAKLRKKPNGSES